MFLSVQNYVFFVLTQMLVINSDRISIYGNIDLFKLNFNYLLKYK